MPRRARLSRSTGTLPLLLTCALVAALAAEAAAPSRDSSSAAAAAAAAAAAPRPRAAAPRPPNATLLRDGFLRLPRLLSRAAAARWLPRVEAAAAADAAACAPCGPGTLVPPGDPCSGCDAGLSSSAPRVRPFVRARRLEAADAGLAALVRSRALAAVVARALGARRVRLYQASAFVKRPGDAPSFWHADAAACPLDTDKLATLWLALSPAPSESGGGLRFLAGSHLPGVPPPASLRDLSPPARLAAARAWTNATELAAAAGGLALSPPAELAPGDATLHLGWTLHAAGAHAGPPGAPARVALAVSYFVDGARVHADLLRRAAGPAGSSAEAAAGAAEGGRGVRLDPAPGGRGEPVVARVLADDAPTWGAWLARGALVPGARVVDDAVAPVLYDADVDDDEADSSAGGTAGGESGVDDEL